MKKKLLIIGASGHGKVVADIAMRLNRWNTVAFLDDNEDVKTCMGLEVVGKTEDSFKYKDGVDFFIAIGNNETRERIQEKLEQDGLSIVNLIHPNAIIGTDVEIGKGTVVMAGVVINSSTRIGKGCILNTSCTVDHDNIIKDYVHVSPGANLAGAVKIGRRTWIGVGSVVSNNINISEDTVVGAGAVVIKDLPSNCTAVGSPAKVIKFNGI